MAIISTSAACNEMPFADLPCKTLPLNFCSFKEVLRDLFRLIFLFLVSFRREDLPVHFHWGVGLLFLHLPSFFYTVFRLPAFQQGYSLSGFHHFEDRVLSFHRHS